MDEVKHKGGNVHIAIHRSSTFMREAPPVTSLILPPAGKAAVSGQLEQLPYETYALAVFQDMNNNGQLDKNALGIPTEPYAFSNNPTVKWRTPAFREAAVNVNQAEQIITVKLKYWKEY